MRFHLYRNVSVKEKSFIIIGNIYIMYSIARFYYNNINK